MTGDPRSLREPLRAAVLVVSGPAGSGKTALVEDRVRGDRHARFLPVSRHHDAAPALLAGILAAVGAGPDRVDPDDVHDWIGALGQRLAAGPFTTKHPCRLVIDGAEAVTDPAAQLVLRDLVELRPAQLRLIITTRHRNPSWIARSQARGTATVITADELRLRPDQVVALVGADQPELDGWALGVGLVAALGRVRAEGAIRDFLRAEVGDRVTTEVRHLVQAVSVAATVDPGLAIHLSGNPAAGTLLARFADETQFATVSAGPVFTLHPVLARHLRNEFATERWEGYLAVRRRYAAWLVDQGRLDRSTREYLDVGDASTAGATLLAHWWRPVLSGNPEPVLTALADLPPLRLAADSRLCVVMAMASIAAGDPRSWQRWIDVAAAHDSAAHDDVELEPGLSVGLAVAVSRRLAGAVTGAVTGAPTSRAGTGGPRLAGLWCAISAVADGLSLLWSGAHAAASARFRQAEVVSRISGDQLALVHSLSGLALAAALGDGDVVLPADEAIAVADRFSPSCRWVVANAHLALAIEHRDAGSRGAARKAATAALDALDGFPDVLEPRTRALASDVLAALGPADRPRPRSGLSARERRVLRALSGPLTLREIADELFVSHNTVKSQVRSIFRKLGVHDRAGAVAAARSATPA